MKTAKHHNLENKAMISDAASASGHSNQTMGSKYVDTMQETTISNANVILHAHDFYEVLFCRAAGDVEYLVGAERYRLRKGDIVFIAPGVTHCPILPDRIREPYRRDVIRMSEEFVKNIFALEAGEAAGEATGSFLLRTAGTQWEYLGDLFHWGVAEAESKKNGWEVVVMGNTMQLMIHLYRAITEQSAAPMVAEKPELLDQVLEYVESHLHQKITLSEVAHHFYVSQSTITQTFRNKLGISFYRCVTQRRLIAAKRLIEGDKALESIAEQVGFTDYSTFYRAFKQEFGISPRQYRVAHNQGK